VRGSRQAALLPRGGAERSVYGIKADSKNNLYIAQTAGGVQRLVYRGMSQVAAR
jgi:hypothetical protein